MKVRKGMFLIIGLCVMIFSSITTNAESETDATDDVYYGSGTSFNLAVDDKPNIDITQITYEDDGQTFELSMTVDGSIEESDDVSYYVQYVAGATSYFFTYTHGNLAGIATDGTAGDYAPTSSVTDDTITVDFTSYGVGDTTDVVFYGWASMANDDEAWWDYAPWTYAPWYSGPGTGDDDDNDDAVGDDDDNDDTASDDDDDNGQQTTSGSGPKDESPGFEILILIAAIAIALILFRRKK